VINTVSYVELVNLKNGTVGDEVSPRWGGPLELPLPPLLQEILYVPLASVNYLIRFSRAAAGKMIVADLRTPIWLGAIAILPINWCSIGSDRRALCR